MKEIRAKGYSGFIESEADIAAGVKALRRKCPIMRHAHDIAGHPPLRRRPAGFEGLVRIIVAQQVSIASAAAISARLLARISPLTPEAVLDEADAGLKSVGLSAPKIRTLRALATAIQRDGLDLERLARLDDEGVREALCAVKGIGPWTSDVYVMFCIGRADAFASGDLALQIAAGHASGLDARPSGAELLEMAECWRPWRGVAARLLWAYYPHMKKSATPATPI